MMTKLLLVFLLLSAGQIFSQNIDTTLHKKSHDDFEKSGEEKLHADSLNLIEKDQRPTFGMQRLFGCSCCMDTLHNYHDKKRIYVLTNNKRELTEYKSGKKKWTITTSDIFGDANAKIICMDFYEINKLIFIRVSTDQHHADINPQNGSLIIQKSN